MTDATAFLERLAAEPKPFVAVETWLHEDGRVERRDRAPQPRRAMAENGAAGRRRFIGQVCTVEATGRTAVLLSVEVEERG